MPKQIRYLGNTKILVALSILLPDSGNGSNMQEDSNIMATRKLRAEDEVNQATVAGKGKIIAPDLSLSGSINQRNFIENGEQRIEYIFSLSITNIETGLTFWEGEIPVIKITDKDTKTW